MNLKASALIFVSAAALGGCQTATRSQTSDAAALDPTTCVAGITEMGCQSVRTAAYFDHGSAPVAVVEPAPEVVADETVVEDETVDVAAAPDATYAPGCDKAIIGTSPNAVGNPCMTTQQFISSLNISEAQKARTLAQIDDISGGSTGLAH